MQQSPHRLPFPHSKAIIVIECTPAGPLLSEVDFVGRLRF
jgi:hypothetical protein